MRISRLFIVLFVLAPLIHLGSIGPASAGEVIDADITFDEFGWDEAGDNCAAPSDFSTAPYGTAVELCFTLTATSSFGNLSNFRFGTIGAPIATELWNQAASPGVQMETVSGRVGFTAGEETVGLRGFAAEVETEFGGFGSTSASANLTLDSPPIVKTVSTDGTCGTATELTVLEHTEVTYCFSMANPAAALDLVVYLLDDDHLGDLGGRGFTIDPGATTETLVPAVATATVTNTVVSCAFFGGLNLLNAADAHEEACESDSDGSFATATVTVEAPNPVLAISGGVGTDAAVCATEAEVDIAPGTEVFFCATATNTGNVTFDLHTISDTVNGALLTDGAHVLAPGESVTTLDLGITSSATADDTIVNTLSWTASGTVPDPPVAVTAAAVVSTTGESTATAQVVQPTPTPTPAPIAPTPTPTPGVIDEIAFTGAETWPIAIAGLTLVAAGLIVATGARHRQD